MSKQIGVLSSAELVGNIEYDLAKRVELLKEKDVIPELAIFNDNLDYEPSVIYSNIKVKTATKLGMLAVLHEDSNTDNIAGEVVKASNDPSIHGIIVQMPSVNKDRTEELLRLINPEKDVDGLGLNAPHLPATAMAIIRLLEHYGIDPHKEKVAMLGQGRLVGSPLFNYLYYRADNRRNIKGYDEHNDPLDIIKGINDASLIITAMGLPKELTSDLFENMSPKTLVDAGSAELGGVIVGDVSDELREAALHHGWNITPEKGGVGPVTVRVLLENTVINAESFANTN